MCAQEAVHGVVPYLGTFLTDLTMIHSAYPDHIKVGWRRECYKLGNERSQYTVISPTQGGLINFEKRRMEFEILAKMSLFQAAATQYSYTSSIDFEHWLETTPVLSEQER